MLLQTFVHKLLCEHVLFLLEIHLGVELASVSGFCGKKYPDVFLFFFLSLFIYFERGRECPRERGREKVRIPSRLCAVSARPPRVAPSPEP